MSKTESKTRQKPIPTVPGNFCVIRLNNNKCTIVDAYWWVQIHKFNWRAKKSRGGWYAFTKIKTGGRTRYIYMHRLIKNTPKGMHCHHIRRNTLDNRDHMLENVTIAKHKELRRMNRITRYSEEIPFAELCGIL